MSSASDGYHALERLEGDEVSAEHAGEELHPLCDAAEELRRREGDVQEERDGRVRQLSTQESRDEHEVVSIDAVQYICVGSNTDWISTHRMMSPAW